MAHAKKLTTRFEKQTLTALICLGFAGISLLADNPTARAASGGDITGPGAGGGIPAPTMIHRESLLNGTYGFRFTGKDKVDVTHLYVGSITFDGAGAITDMRFSDSYDGTVKEWPPADMPFAGGDYSVTSHYTGQFTVHFIDDTLNDRMWTFDFSLTHGGKAFFMSVNRASLIIMGSYNGGYDDNLYYAMSGEAAKF